MKKHLSKRLTALLLALVLCLGLTVPVGATESSGGTNVRFEQVDNSVVSGSLRNNRVVQEQAETPLYRDTDMVRVSIILSGKSTIEKGFATLNIAENSQAMAYRDRLQAQQDTVASRISQKALGGQALDVVWNLTLAANIISANVPYGDIEAIKAVSGVEDVVLETRYEPAVVGTDPTDPNMATSSSMIGSGLAWAAGYTGAGSRIAIIDTGTDTDHQSFDAKAFEYAIAEDAKKAEKTVADYNLLTVEEIAEKLSKLNASKRSSGLTADDLYLTSKLPFGYNYIDKGLEITHDKDTQGEHGSHVAGIATANRYIPDGNGGYSEALKTVLTQGVAPDAQLLTMKVFGKNGGAYDSDYMAAIEDAIVLGCDSINLSLGSSSAGAVLSDDYQDVMDMLEGTDTVVCISAGNSGSWADETSYGLLYNDDVNLDTVGSPGSFGNAFTVASINNDGGTSEVLKFSGADGVQKSVAFYESQIGNSGEHYTNELMSTLATDGKATEYDFILFDNTGVAAGEGDEDGESLLTDYKDDIAGKVVLVNRGASSFASKHMAVAAAGGVACVVANNQAGGTFGMALSGSDATIPCVSISKEDGQAIKAAATPVEKDGQVVYYTGKVVVAPGVEVLPGTGTTREMSDFSSWGVPGDLSLKPEITAPGGNIYSVNGAVAGGQAYENMSGTSMAAPQVTGMVAVLAQYLRENGLVEKTGVSARHLAQSLLMSTAEPVVDANSDYYYPVIQQGAGLANVNAAIQAHSYLTVAGQTDGKVKVELGDDPGKTGIYTATFTIHNFTNEAQSYALSADVFTQDLAQSSSGTLFLYPTMVPLDAVVVWDTESSSSRLDVQAILDYVAGKAQLTKAQMEAYDLDGDGEVTSYDAYLALQSSPDSSSVVVPANGSLTVTATIGLGAEAAYLDNYYPNGAYIEAYLYAKESATDEGVEGTVHSIPVLGFYGNWTDASMYDVGDSLAYDYETESRYPYLYSANGYEGNSFSIKYAGESGEYRFGGNPYGNDNEYDPDRNAFNPGNTLYKVRFAAIRNAGDAIWQVTDAETGHVYYRSDDLGAVTAAYYSASAERWGGNQYGVTLNWQGTDQKGNPLANNTKVEVSLVLAPEYYADENGEYDWTALTDAKTGELGKGAYFTMPLTIDSEAPKLTAVHTVGTGEQADTLALTATDNQYIAYVALFNSDGDLLEEAYPNQEEAGAKYEAEFDFSEITTGENSDLYLAVVDYADNQSTYKLILGKDTSNPGAPDTIELNPSQLTLVKGTSAALTVKYTPWVVQEGVDWTSDNAKVATVNENGIVTGVGVGTATITAASKVNSEIKSTCTVEVITYDITLVGALQDEDGKPLLFTWDMGADATWEKYADLSSNIAAVTYDFTNDVMYQMNGSGYLYQVNPDTGEVLGSAAPQYNGLVVDDMEMAHYFNDQKDTNYIYGIYGNYILIGDGTNNFAEVGFPFEEDGVRNFTSIAWAGGYTYRDMKFDVFYLTDDANRLWVTGLEPEHGYMLTFKPSSYPIEKFNKDFPGYEGSYYCSMVTDDDFVPYLSYFNGETNQIYRLEEDEENDLFTAILLGDVGDGVWPCALLAVLDNNAETGGEGGDSQDALRPARNLPENVIAVEAASTELVLNTVSQAGGSLNAVKVTDSTAKNAAVKTAGINGTGVSGLTTVTLDVTAEESTNGKLTFDYDAKTLTLVSVNTEKDIMSSYNDVDGKLTFAYAAAEAVNGKVATLTFSYDQNTCPNTTDVTSTTLEDGEDLDLKATKTITFKLRNTVVIPGEPSTPVTPAEPELPFTDVTEEHPFYEDIKYVYGKGLMKGVSSDLFQSTASTSRGMIAAILYRMEGEPAVSGSNPFSDVADGSYCDNATVWAAKCGVVKGYGDGTFRPGQAISREQMAAILYRYAQYKGRDVSVGEDTNILSYTDAAQVAEFAVPAFQWAVGAGIINGTSTTTLSPKGNATRGQVAAILHRYAEWIG